MTTSLRYIAVAVMVACGLFAGANVASAAGLPELRAHAAQLEGQTRALRNDIRARYYRTGSFPMLLQSAEQLAQLADHVNDVVRHSSDLDHMQADLVQMERQIAVVERWLDRAAVDPRVIGSDLPTRNLLARIDALCNHVQSDLRDCSFGHHHGPQPGFGGGYTGGWTSGYRPLPGYGGGFYPGGSGITIGSGGGLGGGGFYIGGRGWGIQLGR